MLNIEYITASCLPQYWLNARKYYKRIGIKIVFQAGQGFRDFPHSSGIINQFFSDKFLLWKYFYKYKVTYVETYVGTIKPFLTKRSKWVYEKDSNRNVFLGKFAFDTYRRDFTPRI
jgi:tRNA U34 5-methylaminomethyl-2-thiouridine-forming methyltransferase MnmC